MKRVVLHLLRRTLPGDWARDIVVELEEAHEVRRRERGGFRAGLWLGGQALVFTFRFAVERIREILGGFRERGKAAALVRDVGRTFRSLRRAPAFFAGVVLTLAVGLGANTAIFTIVRTVLLEPLPYPEADRLVVIEPNPWTPAEILTDLRQSGTAVETLAGFYPRRFTVTGDQRPEEMEGAVVTPDFLGLLGATPALGRSFREEDARPGAARTVILSHGTWQRRFGGSPGVLGRTLRLDGVPHEVVGVMEEGFRQLTPRTDEPRLWTVAGLERLGQDVLPEGSIPWAIPLALLARDAPSERARAELDRAVARHLERSPDATDGPRWRLRWTRLHADLTGGPRHALLLLQAAVGLVLVLACVNVANLLLVRMASRRREVAIRAALGASRGRLFRQLLTESLVLALLGGLAGLGLMVLSLDLILALAPPDLPRIAQVTVDFPIFLAALAASLATGVAFGVVPALVATGEPPARSLKEGGRTTTGSRGRHRLSQGLVVAQVTVTLILVVGAGLLVRSFLSLSAQEPGFRTRDVLAVRMSAPEHRYGSVEELGRYQRSLVERLRSVPGVGAVGLANNLPLSRGSAIRSYVVEGESEARDAQYGVVSPGYFRTLDIPVVEGRAFRDGDDRSAPRVAVVDRAMAREAWPEGDPVGRRFRFEDDESWITVVGVSGSIRGSGLGAAPEPGFHIPLGQRPDTPVELGVGKDMVLLVRLEGVPGAMAGALREAVWDVDPGQPVPEIASLESVVGRSTSPQRFRAVLVGFFAAVALLLAVAGIYGVVGNLLAERIHEFGIRRALGADAGDVVKTVLAWGLRLTFVGIAAGLVGVALMGRFLADLLFGVGSGDPGTTLAGVGVVIVVTLVACLVPAYRASRVDALVALRTE